MLWRQLFTQLFESFPLVIKRLLVAAAALALTLPAILAKSHLGLS